MSVAASRRGTVASVCLLALWLAVAGTARGQGIPDSPAPEAPAQASGQEATTGQAATANADAAGDHPTNVVVSVRVNSPGDDGPVKQSSTVAVGAEATNTAATAQKAQQAETGGQDVAG